MKSFLFSACTWFSSVHYGSLRQLLGIGFGVVKKYDGKGVSPDLGENVASVPRSVLVAC